MHHAEVRAVRTIHEIADTDRAGQTPFVSATGESVVVGSEGETKFPHLREAMDALIAADSKLHNVQSGTEPAGDLHMAIHELSESSTNALFLGRRQKAIDHAKHAYRVLEGGDLAESDRLTRVAIDDLQFCLSQ